MGVGVGTEGLLSLRRVTPGDQRPEGTGSLVDTGVEASGRLLCSVNKKTKPSAENEG